MCGAVTMPTFHHIPPKYNPYFICNGQALPYFPMWGDLWGHICLSGHASCSWDERWPLIIYCRFRTKEQVFLNLGPDWFLLLLQGHLHPSTTTLALKLLLYFLSNPSLRGRFRDGLSAGCWVECSMEGVDIVMGECVAASRKPSPFCPGYERRSSPAPPRSFRACVALSPRPASLDYLCWVFPGPYAY